MKNNNVLKQFASKSLHPLFNYFLKVDFLEVFRSAKAGKGKKEINKEKKTLCWKESVV